MELPLLIDRLKIIHLATPVPICSLFFSLRTPSPTSLATAVMKFNEISGLNAEAPRASKKASQCVWAKLPACDVALVDADREQPTLAVS